ncbi:MAG: hypothetical protein COV48_09020 [Elusimicrobia bacterium CG11_big_fil_rev_8_21_14_0_20_64_6]|nr:MAG: hypothetical protein COV48_09020 [Elusimicrobia bacterium CG11_big_fil_rev_8_21_14_0_20_64_6]
MTTSSPEISSSRLFIIGAGLLLLALGVTMFAPFLTALLAAASVALLLRPVYRSLSARAPKHSTAIAAALTALISLLVAVPLFFGGWTILREAAQAYPAARAWVEDLSRTDAPDQTASPRLTSMIDSARDYAEAMKIDPQTVLLENLNRISAGAAKFAKSLVMNAASVFLNLAVFTASLFLFLRDGPRMIRTATELIPLPTEKKEKLVTRVRGVLFAVASGVFLIALMQGVLSWAGFALFRVPFAVLLGTICAVFAPIPFVGTALVWVPVALYLLLSGAAGKAAALTLWFIVIVSLSDNLARPILLGSQMKLPIPLVFISVIAAMKAFGFAGLFIGPLVIALAFGFVDILQDDAPRR